MSAVAERTHVRPVVRTHAQRQEALVTANKVRSLRAVAKRQMAARELSASSIIESPEWWARSWKVKDLLESIPKLGPIKVRKVMNYCRISTSKTVGGISDRQRDELLRLLALDGR